LEQNLDGINRSFDSSVRKNIRKCNEAGVTVEITNDASSIPIYLEMLSSFRKSRGFPLPPFHPNFMSMKLFSREHTSMDIAFASVNGTPIAAMGYVTFGKIVTEIAVAESEEFFRLKLSVNDLIKVKAIETYKLRGMKYYDVTGGKKYTEDPKEQNINKFKRKFGKRLAEFQRIEHQYIKADSFIYKVNVNVLKAKQMFDKFLRLPSKVKRKVGQYYL
jgi:lipid II:glycine glycyltransferase (peptidoglycan interpeptide bridge formation enzyme)